MESEEDFCCFSDCLRMWRGERGDVLSTSDRLEKRDDEEDGREKLRMPPGGPGPNSLRIGGPSIGVSGRWLGVWPDGAVSSGVGEGSFCGHASRESTGKSSSAAC